jgi:hypothetical protein
VGKSTYRIDRGEVSGLTGPYLYANHFAGGLCLTLPVLIAACIRVGRGKIPVALTWSLAIGVAACGVWMVATFARSRAGTASLVVALLVLFAAAYSFAGLSVVHALIGKLQWRGAALGALYGAILVFGWPIAVVALLGLVEPYANLKARAAGAPPQV